MDKNTPISLDVLGVPPSTLFAPLANLIGLMAGRNLPIINQILQLLSTVSLDKALCSLQHMDAYNQGILEHGLLYDKDSPHIQLMDRHPEGRLPREAHEHVSDFFTKKPEASQIQVGRKRKVAIGTISELFGPRVKLQNVKNLLTNVSFLRAHGLELCTPQDVLVSSSLNNLEVLLPNANESRVAIGMSPINDLIPVTSVSYMKSPYGIFQWSRRRRIGGLDSTFFLQLEAASVSDFSVSTSIRWMFIVDENDVNI